MAHKTSTQPGADGLPIFYQEWLPDQPKAVVVLVHGLGEHSGRYQHVAEAFNKAGYALLSMDLPGHGQSGGARGHIASTNVVMGLISAQLDAARQRFPGLPLFLYGHSMGGSLVLFYSIQRKPVLNGVIVTSPGLGTGEPVPPTKKLFGRLMYSLAPAMAMANGLDRENLSQDHSVIERYASDPLVHDRISVRLALDLLGNGDWMVANAAKFPASLPLLLMQGSGDHVVSPEKTQRFAEQLGSQLTYKVWDGLYHELHNEPQQNEVIQTMIDWMDAHR